MMTIMVITFLVKMTMAIHKQGRQGSARHSASAIAADDDDDDHTHHHDDNHGDYDDDHDDHDDNDNDEISKGVHWARISEA